MKRCGGVPSGAAQVIATGFALPKITVIVEFSREPLYFNKLRITPYRCDSVCPPKFPCALRWCCITFPEVYRSKGVPQRRRRSRSSHERDNYVLVDYSQKILRKIQGGKVALYPYFLFAFISRAISMTVRSSSSLKGFRI